MVARIRAAIQDTLDAIEANAKADVRRATTRLMDLEGQGLGNSSLAQANRLSIAIAHFRLAVIGRLHNGG